METKNNKDEYLESRKLTDSEHAYLNERRSDYKHALQIVIQYLDHTNNSDTDLRYFVDRILNHFEKPDKCSHKIANRFSAGMVQAPTGPKVFEQKMGYECKFGETDFDYNKQQYQFWKLR